MLKVKICKSDSSFNYLSLRINGLDCCIIFAMSMNGLEVKCDHDDDSHDESLPWFDRHHKDFIELQKIILNPELLASFKCYTCFR